jgi:hypothetical protein
VKMIIERNYDPVSLLFWSVLCVFVLFLEDSSLKPEAIESIALKDLSHPFLERLQCDFLA